MWRKEILLHTADGDVKDYSHMENSSEVPQNRTTI
jgi:hypothetical protein